MIAIISNAKATKNIRKPRLIKDIAEKLVAKKEELNLKITNKIEEIKDVLAEFRNQKVRLLCIHGGDGTMQCVSTELFSVYNKEGEQIPILAPMAGGANNVISSWAGYKLRKLTEFLKRKEELPTVRVNLLKIKSELSSKIEHGFIFALGLPLALLEKYYAAKPSKHRAIWISFLGLLSAFSKKFRKRYFPKLELFETQVKVDGKKILPGKKFSCLVVSCIRRVNFGFKPFSSDYQSNKFFIAAYSLSFFEGLISLPWILWGKTPPWFKNKIFNSVASEVVIRTNQEFTIDGELFLNKKGNFHTICLSQGPEARILDYKKLRVKKP